MLNIIEVIMCLSSKIITVDLVAAVTNIYNVQVLEDTDILYITLKTEKYNV